MRKKYLSLFLAVAVAVTSLNSSAMMVAGADFTSGPVEVTAEEAGAAVQGDTGTPAAEISAQSADFTSEGAAVSDTPSVTEQPAVEPEQPVTETVQPEVVTEQPAAETTQPADSFTSEPSAVTEQPAAGTAQPVPEETVPEVTVPEETGAPEENIVVDFGDEVSEEPEVLIEEEAVPVENDALFASEEAEVFSAGDANTSVIPLDRLTELALDTEYTVDITEPGGDAWFSFTPAESGAYSFYSESDSDVDSIVYFYDRADITDKGERVDEDDQGGGNNAFRLTRNLEAGKTYYYCAQMYSADQTGTFRVCMERVPVVTSITATLETSEAAAGIPYSPMASIVLSSDDGKSDVLDLNRVDSVYSYRYDTWVSIVIRDQNGQEYYVGDSLPAGQYTVKFVTDTLESPAYTLNVAELTSSSIYYGNLAVGENPGTKSSERNYAYYAFTPEETGIYMLRNVPNLEVYAQSDNGYVSVYPGESGYELTAGTTYYFVLWGTVSDDNGNEAEECNAELVKQRQVESVTFEPKVNEAYAGLDSGYDVFYGKLTVTYTGASDPYMTENAVTGMYRDEDGHPIELIIEDGAGNYYNGWYNLNPGSYNVTVKCGDVSSQPYTLTVRDPEEAPQIYVGENPVNTAASGYCWYKFVPEATGTYDFNSRASMAIYEKTEDGNDWVNSFGSKYRLTGGVSYYVGFNGTAWDDEGNETDHFILTIELMPELESITAVLNTTEAAAGFSCNLAADISLKYNNGETGTITWELGNSYDNDPYGGGEITAVIQDEAGNTFSTEDVLPAGTYTVKFVRNQVESGETTLTVRELTDSPLYHGELKLGSNPDTLTLDDRYSYYSFAPESTGGYILRKANAFDVWEKTEEGYVNIASGGGSGLFELTAGNTYYFRFWDAFEDWDENGTPIYIEKFDAFLEMQSEVQSVTFEPAVTEVYKDVDSLPDAFWGKLKIEYTNGEEPYETADNVFYFGGDRYYNPIEVIIWDADGNRYSPYDNVDVGEYTVSIRCGDVESDSYTLTVKTMDPAVLPVLQVGENTVRANSGINNWYVFTAPETGVYWFNISTGATTVRKVEEDGSYTDASDILWNNEIIEKDARYLVGFSTWSMDSADEIPLTIVRKPEVSSLEITDYSPQKLEFVEKIDYVGLDGVTATVSFSDGTSGEYKLGDSDDFGRWLGYELCRKEADGSYTPLGGQDVPVGDYVFRVYFGENGIESEVCADVPVKVVTLEESVDADLPVEGEEIYENTDESQIYRFIPETGGRYQFKFNVPLTSARFFDSENNRLDVKRTDYEIFADLEEGMTYYLYYTVDPVYYSQMRVTVNLLTRPSQLKTTALKDHYIAGLDEFTGEDMQTVVANEDGTSRTIRGRDDVRGGYYLQYRVENGEESIGYGAKFTPGTWTVTPYLSAYATSGSAVAAIDIPAEGTTVVAENVDPADLPAITLGEWITVPYQGYQRILYAFTPEKAGTYTIEDQSEYYISWGFYTPGENGLESTGYDEITLEAGKTCVAVVEFYGASAFRIVEQEESENPEEPDIPGDPPVTEGPLTLTDGLRKVIDIQEEGKVINCTFTPTEDGVYRIWSEDYPLIGMKDTFVELYCDGDRIYENDDGGSDWNFDFSYYLSAGKTYTYKVRMRSEYELGLFILSFAKADWKQISNIELVEAEGNTSEDFTIHDTFSSAFNAKITYKDGTVVFEDSNVVVDDYQNTISFNVQMAEKDDEKILYNVWYSYGMPGIDEIRETEKKQIVQKNFDSLAQIELDKVYETPADDLVHYYYFSPQTTGKYIFIPETGNISFDYFSEIIYDQVANDRLNIYFNEIWPDYVGEKSWTVNLTAGKKYRLEVQGSWDVDVETFSFRLSKLKPVKDIEIVKNPDQTTCLPDGFENVSLEGMQVKVTYADGTEETVVYGGYFKSGYGILRDYNSEWVSSNILRVYISVGGYRAGFDLTFGSMDDLPETTVNQAHTFEAKRGDIKAVKFVPAATGIYTTVGENGYLDRVIDGDFTDISYNLRQLYLQEGQTYYLYVFAVQDNPTITITLQDEHECIWVEESRTESCTEEGELKEVCTICGAVRVTPIPPQGHDLGEWTETKAATCAEEGEETRTCSRCDYSETQPIEKLPHTWGDWTETKAATCAEEGEETRTCSECGETETQPIERLAHTWGEWSETKAATCTEEGEETRTCSECGETETQSIAAAGHKEDTNWTVTKAATCTAAGTRVKKCTVCKAELKKETIKATGHKFSNWSRKKNPTCTVAGQDQRTCSVCKRVETRSVNATGKHSYGGWTVTRKATALATGVQQRTCTVCKSAKQTQTIAKLRATLTLNVSAKKTIPLKVKQALNVRASRMASGDSVASWKSSNTRVAIVARNGRITGRKAGTATITVRLRSGYSTWFRVKVQNSNVQTTSLRVKNASTGQYMSSRVTLNKYARLRLTPVIAPITSRYKATYTSSNRSVVTVTASGIVTARKKGAAYVTVKSGRKSVRIRVTVRDPYVTTALRVKNAATGRYITRATLNKYARLTLSPVIAPRTSRQKATYSSSNRRIVTVTSRGVITARRKGTAYVTVKSGVKSVRLRITVKDPYVTTALRVKNAASGRYITRATLRRNARLTLQPVIAPRTSRQKATFASSNRRIVTVNSAGVVTAKRRGTAYITVKSGSKSVRLRITVR